MPRHEAPSPELAAWWSYSRARVRLGGGTPARLTAPPAPVAITFPAGASATVTLPGDRDRPLG